MLSLTNCFSSANFSPINANLQLARLISSRLLLLLDLCCCRADIFKEEGYKYCCCVKSIITSGQYTFSSCSPLIQRVSQASWDQQQRKYAFVAAQKERESIQVRVNIRHIHMWKNLILRFLTLWIQIVAVIYHMYSLF